MFILKFVICFSFNFLSLKISYQLNHRKIFISHSHEITDHSLQIKITKTLK